MASDTTTTTGIAEQINTAIGAHGMWKNRLKAMIESRSTGGFEIAKVRADNQCDFGKWLYGPLPAEVKSSSEYPEIRALHAEFHEAAANVARLAAAGNAAEALESLKPGGEYANVSTQLTMKMMAWGKKFGS